MVACVSIVIFRLTADNVKFVLYDLLSGIYIFMTPNFYSNVLYYLYYFITVVVTVVFDILSLLMLLLIIVSLIRIGMDCVKIISNENAKP